LPRISKLVSSSLSNMIGYRIRKVGKWFSS
jgi:hypothetical protein